MLTGNEENTRKAPSTVGHKLETLPLSLYIYIYIYIYI